MKILKRYLILMIVLVSTSCDCLQHVQGVVLDADTQLPINNVRIINNYLADSLQNTDMIIHTDSIGEFDFTSMAVGLFGCPKVSLSFEKKGYEIIDKKYKSCCTDGVIINLKKK